MGKKRDDHLASACPDAKLHRRCNGFALHLSACLAVLHISVGASPEELHDGVHPVRGRWHVQRPRVLPVALSGRRKRKASPSVSSRFCRRPNRASNRKDTPCCPIAFGGRPGIPLALQSGRTEVGRPVSAPVAQPNGLRGQGPFRALRHQLRRGRSLPRCHALVRCSL
jgi:hypothetical protein